MKKTVIALGLALFTTSALAQMDHSKMDHGKMDHGSMNHGEMDHSNMDHSNMDHSNMMGMQRTSSVGMPANGAKPDKVIHVILSDDKTITFKKAVDIEPNDVVQFVVMNTGEQPHEFSIGSKEELQSHRKMMSAMAGMEHDTKNSIVVEPKKARQFMWHFHGDSDVEFACNFKGHAEAGMTKTIKL
ncbi:copper-resistant cuproprotein CopI [Vibrio fortis]|uniref:copper-resistant cuproprotein CopI n=1 Tax=Vibrio fortis TaxID=212667 RepID=UPI003EB76B51